jgi:hypothetical protein
MTERFHVQFSRLHDYDSFDGVRSDCSDRVPVSGNAALHHALSRFRMFPILAICLGSGFLLTGCYSPQEKSGVSGIPQNTPSKWETRSSNYANQ